MVYQQPWTNTIRVSQFTVLERKGIPPVPKVAESLYTPLADYINDSNFQKIDMFVRNRYAAMLNNAVVYEVLRTADSTAYKIQYQVGDKLVTVFNQKNKHPAEGYCRQLTHMSILPTTQLMQTLWLLIRWSRRKEQRICPILR